MIASIFVNIFWLSVIPLLIFGQTNENLLNFTYIHLGLLGLMQLIWFSKDDAVKARIVTSNGVTSFAWNTGFVAACMSFIYFGTVFLPLMGLLVVLWLRFRMLKIEKQLKEEGIL